MDLLRLFYKESELVVSPTRTLKPATQAAENITVITSREIEAMNAHTVAEVLTRVTGLFVDFGGEDYGSTAQLRIQGANERHVLVVVDGVVWNLRYTGSAETITIPVRIIERIEVIKGPASSAWGSSFGGVVNIITKSTGETVVPHGSLGGYLGERSSQDESAEAWGKAGSLGYYLYAGRQESEGLRDDRSFRNYSLYSKLSLPVTNAAKLTATAAYSEPHVGFGDFPSGDITTTGDMRSFFATLSLDAAVTDDISLLASGHTSNRRTLQDNKVLGLGMLGSPGDAFLRNVVEEKTTGGNYHLLWTQGTHNVSLGLDMERVETESRLDSGAALQSMGAPAVIKTNIKKDDWAVYANDTIALDAWSITLGIRYDEDSIVGSFTSPSLGITYSLSKETVVRASLARGFNVPPLGATNGGALFMDPNPDLVSEEGWSYQAGMETVASKWLRLKGVLFLHDLEKTIERSPQGGGPPAYNDLVINDGRIRRTGFEVEAETIAWHDLSLRTGFSYINKKESPKNADAEENNIYASIISLRYDDNKRNRGEVFGRYVWWDKNSSAGAEYHNFIWDLNLARKIFTLGEATAELGLTIHNLTNSRHYTMSYSPNPGRWVEGGLRVRF